MGDIDTCGKIKQKEKTNCPDKGWQSPPPAAVLEQKRHRVVVAREFKVTEQGERNGSMAFCTS